MRFQAYNLKDRCQKLFIYFAHRVPFWSFLICAFDRPVTLEITETAFSRVMPSAQNPEIGSKKVEHPWNRNHHFFSAVQGDIAIECGLGSNLCGSMQSLYYKQRDRLREYYYGGQYDADLRRKKAQEWIDKVGGSTNTDYYRDRVNNRE